MGRKHRKDRQPTADPPQAGPEAVVAKPKRRWVWWSIAGAAILSGAAAGGYFYFKGPKYQYTPEEWTWLDMDEKEVDDLLSQAPPKIRKMYFQDDEEVDIAKADFVLSKCLYPDLSVDKALQQLEGMVDQVNRMISEEAWRKGIADPRHPGLVIRMLNRFLYQKGPGLLGMDYDWEDWKDEDIDNDENAFLWRILKDQKGCCMNLGTLYVVMAQRLGLPCSMVSTNKHVFVRYDDGKKRINLEPTPTTLVDPETKQEMIIGGWREEEENYIKRLEIPQGPISTGVYLRGLTRKETVSVLLGNVAGVTVGKEDEPRKEKLDTAARFCRLSLLFNPRNMHAHENLASLEQHRGNYEETIRHFARSFNLGQSFPVITQDDGKHWTCSKERLLLLGQAALRAGIEVPPPVLRVMSIQRQRAIEEEEAMIEELEGASHRRDAFGDPFESVRRHLPPGTVPGRYGSAGSGFPDPKGLRNPAFGTPPRVDPRYPNPGIPRPNQWEPAQPQPNLPPTANPRYPNSTDSNLPSPRRPVYDPFNEFPEVDPVQPAGSQRRGR